MIVNVSLFSICFFYGFVNIFIARGKCLVHGNSVILNIKNINIKIFCGMAIFICDNLEINIYGIKYIFKKINRKKGFNILTSIGKYFISCYKDCKVSR